MDYKKLYEQTLAENDKLKEENEKLKKRIAEETHFHWTMCEYLNEGDWGNTFDEWFRDYIGEDDKKYEWVKEWMENTEYCDDDSDDDDDE